MPVYHPTPSQWAMGLVAFVRDVVEPSGGHKAGLCRIVPPSTWEWGSATHQDQLRGRVRLVRNAGAVPNAHGRSAAASPAPAGEHNTPTTASAMAAERHHDSVHDGSTHPQPAAAGVDQEGAAGAGVEPSSTVVNTGDAPTPCSVGEPRKIKPVRQHTSGMRGVYKLDMVETKPVTVEAFAARAACHTPATSVVDAVATLERGRCHEDADAKAKALEVVDRAFWRSMGSVKRPAEYGADQVGTLFGAHDVAGGWNVNHLDSLLHEGVQGLGGSLRGVTEPMLYFGMWRAQFAWHTEDLDLFSVNYLHFGAPKVWYVVPPSHGARLEAVAAAHFGGDRLKCAQFLRHKNVVLSPTVLRAAGVTVLHCEHRAGEFMVTFPRSYHAGYNAGYNCAESVNFALPSWIPVGRRASWCVCEPTTVRMDVDSFLEIVRQGHPHRLPAHPSHGDRVMVRWPDLPGWRLVRLYARSKASAAQLLAVPTTWAQQAASCVAAATTANASASTPKSRQAACVAGLLGGGAVPFDTAVEWRWVQPCDREPPKAGDVVAMQWKGFTREFLVRLCHRSNGGQQCTGTGKKTRRRGVKELVARSALHEEGFGEWPFDVATDTWRWCTPEEVAKAQTCKDEGNAAAAVRGHRRKRRRPKECHGGGGGDGGMRGAPRVRTASACS